MESEERWNRNASESNKGVAWALLPEMMTGKSVHPTTEEKPTHEATQVLLLANLRCVELSRSCQFSHQIADRPEDAQASQ